MRRTWGTHSGPRKFKQYFFFASTCLLALAAFLGRRSSAVRVQSSFAQPALPLKTHVFLATSSADLRPLFVAVNSTLTTFGDLSKLRIVIFLPPSVGPAARSSFVRLLPHAVDIISIDTTSLNVDMITNLPGVLPTKHTKRKELADPYNFAPFYISEMRKYASLSKVIYLDTDVVVRRDLVDLLRQCCEQGTVAAVVEDCSQHLATYINKGRLKDNIARMVGAVRSEDERLLSADGLHRECVFNRGVVVLDIGSWNRMGITRNIEAWMRANLLSEEPLYSQGVSQPPFLLALLHRYTKLGFEWNTRGLGRDVISEGEINLLLKNGMEREYLTAVGLTQHPLHKGKTPFISPFTDQAFILHFNGKHKPWLHGRQTNDLASVCGSAKVPCSTLWWEHLSSEAESLLAPLA